MILVFRLSMQPYHLPFFGMFVISTGIINSWQRLLLGLTVIVLCRLAKQDYFFPQYIHFKWHRHSHTQTLCCYYHWPLLPRQQQSGPCCPQATRLGLRQWHALFFYIFQLWSSTSAAHCFSDTIPARHCRFHSCFTWMHHNVSKTISCKATFTLTVIFIAGSQCIVCC